jgi:hypothetical protein
MTLWSCLVVMSCWLPSAANIDPSLVAYDDKIKQEIDHGNVYSRDHEAMVAETLYSCNCKYVHICSSPFPVFSCLISVKLISFQYIPEYMSSLLDTVSCFDRGAHRDPHSAMLCFLKY